MTFVSKIEAHPTNAPDAYPPGTVAVATVHGVQGVRVMPRMARNGVADGWVSSQRVENNVIHYGDDVTDVRPLVVLDPNSPIVQAYLQQNDEGNPSPLATLIREQLRPQRIPEPGPWGVVEAGIDGSAERYHYVRRGTDGCWYTLRGAQRRWNELLDPTLIREGINA